MIAFRDIEAGEELTLSCKFAFFFFPLLSAIIPIHLRPSSINLPSLAPVLTKHHTDIDLGKTHAERQRALQRWGFTCTCAMCTASASEIAESDARRSRIQELKKSVVEALKAPSSPPPQEAAAGEEKEEGKDRTQRLAQAISHAEEALALTRAEELRSLYAEQHDALGRLYWAAGDRELAVDHARLSLEVLEDVGYVAHDPAHLPRLLSTYGRLGVGGGSALGISREGLVG